MTKEEIEFELEHDLAIAIWRVIDDKAVDVAHEVAKALMNEKIRHVKVEYPQ